jgi:hypothetical protein
LTPTKESAGGRADATPALRRGGTLDRIICVLTVYIGEKEVLVLQNIVREAITGRFSLNALSLVACICLFLLDSLYFLTV